VPIIGQLLTARYQEFGGDDVTGMATLRELSSSLAHLKEQAMCRYFTLLLAYENYAELAKFVLTNAAHK
jgi:hypothetical protein